MSISGYLAMTVLAITPPCLTTLTPSMHAIAPPVMHASATRLPSLAAFDAPRELLRTLQLERHGDDTDDEEDAGVLSFLMC